MYVRMYDAEDYTEGCGLETNYLRPMAQYVLWKFAGYRISRSVHNRGRGTECIFFALFLLPFSKINLRIVDDANISAADCGYIILLLVSSLRRQIHIFSRESIPAC